MFRTITTAGKFLRYVAPAQLRDLANFDYDRGATTELRTKITAAVMKLNESTTLKNAELAQTAAPMLAELDRILNELDAIAAATSDDELDATILDELEEILEGSKILASTVAEICIEERRVQLVAKTVTDGTANIEAVMTALADIETMVGFTHFDAMTKAHTILKDFATNWTRNQALTDTMPGTEITTAAPGNVTVQWFEHCGNDIYTYQNTARFDNGTLDWGICRVTNHATADEHLAANPPKPGTPEHDTIRSASKIGAWIGRPYTGGDNPYIRERGHAVEAVVVKEVTRSHAWQNARTQAAYVKNGTLATIDMVAQRDGTRYAVEIKTPARKYGQIRDTHLLQMAVQHIVTELPVVLLVAEAFEIQQFDPHQHPAWGLAVELAGHYVHGDEAPNPDMVTKFDRIMFDTKEPEAAKILADGRAAELAAWVKAADEFKRRAKEQGDGEIVDEKGELIATVRNGRFTWK